VKTLGKEAWEWGLFFQVVLGVKSGLSAVHFPLLQVDSSKWKVELSKGALGGGSVEAKSSQVVVSKVIQSLFCKFQVHTLQSTTNFHLI